jgi:hypothetical protein
MNTPGYSSVFPEAMGNIENDLHSDSTEARQLSLTLSVVENNGVYVNSLMENG